MTKGYKKDKVVWDNGVKPTRLWHLSGKKHIARWLRDVMEGVGPHFIRPKSEIMKVVFLGFIGAMAVNYTRGKIFKEFGESKEVKKGCEDYRDCAICEVKKISDMECYGPFKD